MTLFFNVFISVAINVMFYFYHTNTVCCFNIINYHDNDNDENFFAFIHHVNF